MKRSPEKVSGRCARISIYLSPRLSLLSRFEIVSRRCSEAGTKSVESRETSRELCVSFLREEVVRSRFVVGEGGRGEQRHLFSGNCLKPGATGW